MASFRITVAGDSALNVEFGTAIAPETGALVRAAAKQLERHPIAGTTELLPTFCSLMVCYDPLAIGFDELAEALESELQSLSAEKSRSENRYLHPRVLRRQLRPRHRNRCAPCGPYHR